MFFNVHAIQNRLDSRGAKPADSVHESFKQNLERLQHRFGGEYPIEVLLGKVALFQDNLVDRTISLQRFLGNLRALLIP